MMSAPTTVYTNVLFHGKTGKVRLTADKIAFQPDDLSRGAGKRRDDAWRWTAILKHQVNNKNALKALLKLVSKEDPSKCVIFQFPNHDELKTVRRDITERLQQQTYRRRRHSATGSISGHGEFLQQNRRGSDMSFTTVAVPAEVDKTFVTSSRQSATRNQVPSSLSLPSLFPMKKKSDGFSNIPQRPKAVLDPATGVGCFSPKSNQKLALKMSSKSKAGKTEATSKITHDKKQSTLMMAVALGFILIMAFDKAGSLGYLNGVTDNQFVLERLVPRFSLKQPTTQNLDNHGFCFWKYKRSAAIPSKDKCKLALTVLFLP